ncbi:DUF6078 family protein [uncultured Parabacteroides sp.]|uniref:DUF6078 family protein n=1 Tax=uncultured Parabacteroides sp. TaxID=512312 RepID=UPI0025F76063|nr:DUF6078 family protein [uncultured Parabacteroides sp.]
MLEKFDYSQVPHDFAHCFNSGCKHSGNCLRYQITSYIPKECWSVRVINPAQTVPDGDCPGFMSSQKLKYAYGMSHLLDDLPYRKAKEVRAVMREHYGKTYFYRLKRMERCFTPEDQQYVGSLFQRFGIEREPTFDRYEEEYNWDR